MIKSCYCFANTIKYIGEESVGIGCYINLKVDFGIERKWTNDTENGHRVLSNIFQLTELLQKNKYFTKFHSILNLKHFLQNAIQTSENREDAFTQRIEEMRMQSK
jgi:hypothetical protein